MASLATAVFKATIGLLLNKGRDVAAEKLKQGDIADQKLRDIIVREIHDVKSKLDGLARKDLLAAIDYFEEGLVLFYDVLHSKGSPSSNAEAETVSLAQTIRNLKLTDLDESAATVLRNAKKRFEDARRKATEAFNDEALKLSDRIEAMGYRVMATILETVDNPSAALSACRLCLDRLHSLPAVQNCFAVELKKGLRGRFSKDERREIISTICRFNRVIYDVSFMIYGFGNKEMTGIVEIWPCIEIDNGNTKVNPLIDTRVASILRKRDVKHFSVPWSFGQEGEVEHKLKEPWGITTDNHGNFIVADYRDRNVKVFDSTGKFLYSFCPAIDDTATAIFIHDVATDKNDNIYVLVTLKKPGADEDESYVYAKTHHHLIPLKGGFRSWSWTWSSLAVSDNDRVLVRGGLVGGHHVVDVYETDGRFVRRFGEDTLKSASSIAAANDCRVIVADHEDDLYRVNGFSEEGEHLFKFTVERSYHYPQTTFHQESEHIVVAGIERGNMRRLQILIYTKNGELVRSIDHDKEELVYVRGITVTMDGHIAVIYRDKVILNFRVLVI